MDVVTRGGIIPPVKRYGRVRIRHVGSFVVYKEIQSSSVDMYRKRIQPSFWVCGEIRDSIIMYVLASAVVTVLHVNQANHPTITRMSPITRSDSTSLNEAFAINAPGYAIGVVALVFSALTLIFMVVRWRKKNEKSDRQHIDLEVVGDAGVCRC
jgi:hypothetical protein